MTLKHFIGRRLLPLLPFNRRSFDILRFEFWVVRERTWNRLLPWRAIRIRKLKEMRGISLNVGSGGRGLPGWINMDATSNHHDQYCTHDLRRPLPLADGSVRRIMAEHVLEHLDFVHDVPIVFREFHRVLQPGGTLRVVVPDAGRFLRAYADGTDEAFHALGWDLNNLPADIFTPMHVINHVFHQCGEHLFGWDFSTMRWALQKAGFETIVQQTYKVSVDPELAIDQPNHQPYSLYVEAIKQGL